MVRNAWVDLIDDNLIENALHVICSAYFKRFLIPMNMSLIYIAKKDVKNTSVRWLSNCGPERNCKTTGTNVFLTSI
jgi:hypothetical protein